jgi:hypothetical protein
MLATVGDGGDVPTPAKPQRRREKSYRFTDKDF